MYDVSIAEINPYIFTDTQTDTKYAKMCTNFEIYCKRMSLCVRDF